MWIWMFIAFCVGINGRSVRAIDYKAIADAGFAALDKNKDGVLSLAELTYTIGAEDLNHDGQLTLAEYAGYWNTTPDALAPLFNTWDTDGDGRVSVSIMQRYVGVLDQNGDGVVSLHEYEHYMIGYLQCIYEAHGNHGHGQDCNSIHGNVLGHSDWKLAADAGFHAMDRNNDGVLTIEEYTYIENAQDLNHDGQLTLAEYAGYWNTTQESLAPVFLNWDTDGDGRVSLSILTTLWHAIDHDGDGRVSLHDYEQYMIGYLQCVYDNHGTHGHGKDCHNYHGQVVG